MLPFMDHRKLSEMSSDPSSAKKLSQAAQLISAEGDLNEILQNTVDSAREVTSATYGVLAVMSENAAEWETFVTSGMPPFVAQKIRAQPVGRGLLGLLFSNPRPTRVRNISQHPSAQGFPENHPKMTSFLGVPVLDKETLVGGLYLADRIGEEEFTEDDEAVAVLLARHAANAIENARLLERTRLLLKEIQQMKDTRERFYAMINHELRNALTAVYGWAELWLRKTGDDPPRPAIEVYESAERTVVLLEDMLQLSRIDAGKLLPLIQDADGAVVVHEAVRGVEPAAAQKGVRVEVNGVGNELPCRTDPVRMRQILLNLLQNAVRYSPDGELVTLEVRPDGENMRIDVVDRGRGIPEERHEEIFEAFDLDWDRLERGTGLGLDVSRRLARLLGGDLRVESKPGHGARFVLEMPCHRKKQ
jgi:signal transduction histidine kinase